MRCDDVSVLLAGSADEIETLAKPAAQHLASCLRCQAELAQYRKLLRVMKTLRTDLLSPGEDLLTDVLELVRPPATVHSLHGGKRVSGRGAERRRAYIGGIAAAATAAGAGAIVLATRIGGSKTHLAS